MMDRGSAGWDAATITKGDERHGLGERSWVVVHFRESVGLPYENAPEVVDAERIGPWQDLADRFGALRLEPMITSVRSGTLDEFVRAAQRMDPNDRPTEFTSSYWSTRRPTWTSTIWPPSSRSGLRSRRPTSIGPVPIRP